MIGCVAGVGHQFDSLKQNNPLYIQGFTEAGDALKLHHIVHCSLNVVDARVSQRDTQGEVMAGTRVSLNGRLRHKLKTLKRMKAKATAVKVEMNCVKEETTQMVAAMEEIKLEIDLLEASVHHYCDDMLLISGAVDNLSEIIYQL